MEKKRVEGSSITISQIMLPQDANPAGLVHGGVIMKHIDNAAGVVAARHTRTVCVTASIDRLDFHNPVQIGNLVTFKANINYIGKSSMEIGVRVETEDLLTGVLTHTASAYLTFVALGSDFRPAQVPPIEFDTDEEVRRNKDAQRRRESRLSEKRVEKLCQSDTESCPD